MTKSRASAWTAELFAMLSDGEWHSLDKLLFEMGRRVTPGPASREAARVRPPERAVSFEDDIATGKRRIAFTALNNAVRNGHLEVERGDSGQIARVRLGVHRRDYLKTGALAEILGHPSSTITQWLGSEKVLNEVRSLLPDGVEPVILPPGYSRVRFVPIAAVPAWQRVAKRQMLEMDDAIALLQAVGRALDIEDEDEQIRVTQRLREELAKVNRGLFRRNRDRGH